MVSNRHSVMSGMMLPFLVTCLAFWAQIDSGYGLTLYAPVNGLNLVGNITFTQASDGAPTSVALSLSQKEGNRKFNWKIMALPYHFGYQCDPNHMGPVLKDMTALNIAATPTEATDLPLHGPKSIWSSAIIINVDGTKEYTCTNILYDGEHVSHMAQFLKPNGFHGYIYLRSFTGGPTLLVSELFHTDTHRFYSFHDWKILISDNIDSTKPAECHHLTTILEDGTVSGACSTTSHGGCKSGELTAKHGQITIYNDSSAVRYQKFIDTNLKSYGNTARSAFIVIYAANDSKKILSCAQIVPVNAKEVKTYFDMDGVRGEMIFSQTFITHPTVITIKLKNLKNRGVGFKVHNFPVDRKLAAKEQVCSADKVGPVFNPFVINEKGVPGPGIGSTDRYPVGDLSGKHGNMPNENNGETFAGYVDLHLPLFGMHSVVGRSVVIHKADGSNWICANIGYPSWVTTAVVTFHYPVVGKIIFRQETNIPNAETTVYADLSYADGSAASTNHSFHVHEEAPGADWHNATGRCLSTKGHFNPSKLDTKTFYDKCYFRNPYRCEHGDLVSKAGEQLKISASRGSGLVKLFYTDLVLHLSGPYSIIGKSVVIHDKRRSKEQGDRLACARIEQVHYIEANAKVWKTANGTSPVVGEVNTFQLFEPDTTDFSAAFDGLSKKAGGFHVHKVSVPMDAQFPCADSAVQGHFDPFMITASNLSIAAGVGSTDQYEIGDISGKTKSLKELENHRLNYVDYNLPLYGPHSIIGRSLVVHYADGARWICADLNVKVNADQGKEVVALASFHDHRHAISGYVRFRQIEYKDRSISDTWLDVDLKYTGTNRNITKNHKWEIFVHPVRTDAFQPSLPNRCNAGAYIYNPWYTKKVPDNSGYCSPSNPLRCILGDLTGRHGPLEIGGVRKQFTDVNLPIAEVNSIVGRSLIIYAEGANPTSKLACTDIVIDQHMEFSISITRPPRFTVDEFMDSMRTQLRTAKWLVVPDLSSVKHISNDECIMFIVHFYGPRAKNLHDGFSALLRSGTAQYTDEDGSTHTLKSPYRACTANPNLPNISGSNKLILSASLIMGTMIVAGIGASILPGKQF